MSNSDLEPQLNTANMMNACQANFSSSKMTENSLQITYYYCYHVTQ